MIDPSNYFYDKETSQILDEELLKIISTKAALTYTQANYGRVDRDELIKVNGERIPLFPGVIDQLVSFDLIFLENKRKIKEGEGVFVYDVFLNKKSYFFLLSAGGFSKIWEEKQKQEKKGKNQWYLNLFTVFISLAALGLTTYSNFTTSNTQKLDISNIVQERDSLIKASSLSNQRFDSISKIHFHLNNKVPVLEAGGD